MPGKVYKKRSSAKRKSAPKPYNPSQRDMVRFAGRTGPTKRKALGPWGRFFHSDPIPIRLETEMTYCTTTYVTSVASSYSYSSTPLTYKLNTVYHVDGTLNTDGYTMRSSQYWKFKVIGVDIEVSVHKASTTNLCIGLLLTGPGETIGLQNLDCKLAPENAAMHQVAISDVQDRPTVIRRSFRICDLLGVTQEQFMADNTIQYGAASYIGASPDTYALLQVGCANLGAGAAGTIDYQVKLTQRVVWYDRKLNLAN